MAFITLIFWNGLLKKRKSDYNERNGQFRYINFDQILFINMNIVIYMLRRLDVICYFVISKEYICILPLFLKTQNDFLLSKIPPFFKTQNNFLLSKILVCIHSYLALFNIMEKFIIIDFLSFLYFFPPLINSFIHMISLSCDYPWASILEDPT